MPRKPKADNEVSLIDGMELEVLEQYLQGQIDSIPEELVKYMDYMEIIRSLYCVRKKDKAYIRKLLCNEPYDLTAAKFSRLWGDTLNHFYADDGIKAQAWDNIYAEKIERTANALFPLVRSFKDADVWKNMMLAAADLRNKHRKDEIELPEERYRKPVRVYTMDVTALGDGIQKIDPERLKQDILSFDIPEDDKLRIMAEAGVDPPQLKLTGDAPESD